MLFKYQHWLFVFAIYFIVVHAQSIDHTSENDDEQLFVTLANYRHRLDRSMNFKKLRWTASSLNSTPICDACDLLVPQVVLFSSMISCVEIDNCSRCEH